MKTAVEDLIRMIMGDREAAQGYVDDPEGTLAEAGITGAELTADDLRAAVEEACSELDLNPTVQQTINNYTSGSSASGSPSYGSGSSSPAGSSATGGGSAAPAGPAAGGGAPGAPTPPPVTPPPAQPPIEMVQQHINYVTYATYEGDETITQEIINNEITNEITNDITNIDQSTDVTVDLGDHNKGDVTIDVGNIAADDGAVAGETINNAQTGDGVLVNGDNNGAINNAEGGVANAGTIEGGVATGDDAVATGQDSTNVLGDGNTTLAGSISDTSVVSGDVGGDVNSVGDIDDAAVGFGEGDNSNISANTGAVDATQQFGDGVQQSDTTDTAAAQGGGDAFGDLDDAAVNTGDGGGDVTNVSDLEDGAAATTGGGDATGSDIDGSFNDNTASQFEQGPGDQNLEDVNTLDFASPEVEINVDPDFDPGAVRDVPTDGFDLMEG
ncbi:MAG: hypothetical protein AAF945_02595 [Actinomycetota bacterium]